MDIHTPRLTHVRKQQVSVVSLTSLMFAHTSGRFFYSPKQDLFVVHNLYDGFDAYTMKSRAHFRSYRFPASENTGGEG